MNSLRNRTKFVFCLAVGLVFVNVLYSCTSPKPETTPETKQDAPAELISSLKGANVEGYKFATEGDEKLEIVSLTNGLLRDRLKLDGSTANVVLKYASVKDKSANSSRTYKIEVAKAGSEVAVLQIDVATGQLVTKDRFPTAQPHDPNAPKTLDECIAVFNCLRRPALQAEANRTCRAQFAAITCCPTDSSPLCFSVHFIIVPTRRICGLIGPLDDIEVVSSNP